MTESEWLRDTEWYKCFQLESITEGIVYWMCVPQKINYCCRQSFSSVLSFLSLGTMPTQYNSPLGSFGAKCWGTTSCCPHQSLMSLTCPFKRQWSQAKSLILTICPTLHISTQAGGDAQLCQPGFPREAVSQVKATPVLGNANSPGSSL